MATYTPIPYWLSLPWVKTCAWSRRIERIQRDDRVKAGG
jgi:hypothetical protein